MSEELQPGNNSSMLRNVILGIVALYVVFSLYFSYQLNQRILALESKQVESEEKLGKKIAAAERSVQTTQNEFQKRVGETEQAFQARAERLAREQKASESRLTEEQKKQQEALG